MAGESAIDKGVRLFNARRYDEALAAFRRGVPDPRAEAFVAHCLRSLAEATHQRCWAAHKRAEAEMDAGRFARAAAAQREVLRLSEVEPTAPSTKTLRFQTLMRLGRFETAFAQAEAALDVGLTLKQARSFAEPFDAEHFRRGAAARRRALAALAKAGRFAPWPQFFLESNKPVLAKRYGWMNFSIGRRLLHARPDEAARSLLRRSLSFTPRDWRARAFLAEGELCRGRAAAAMREMAAALKLAEGDERAQVLAWRGELSLWLGRYPAAVKDLDEACRLGGLGSEFAFGWRGAAQFKLGRFAQALSDLDRCLAIRPRDHEARTWRGELLRTTGKPREALATLEGEDGFWARVNRGLARRDLGEERGPNEAEASLPAPVRSFLRRRFSERDAAGRLEGALTLARGFRREEYEQAVWMSR